MKEKHAGGRPKIYNTKETKKQILNWVAHGKSLSDIAAMKDQPAREWIHKNLLKDQQFADNYVKAKHQQADFYASQAVNLSKKVVSDSFKGEATREMIMAAKLHIDTIKWITCKLYPRFYGAPIQTEEEVNFVRDKKIQVEFKDAPGLPPSLDEEETVPEGDLEQVA